MPTQPAAGARDRILEAADRLFYAKGIRATGIDEIIAEAGVAKASMYKHFESKDALIAEYVRRRDARVRESLRKRVMAGDASPRERLVRVFDGLAEWLGGEGQRGCAFINANAELADRAHPGARAALAHKTAARDILGELARAAGFRDPARVADQLAILSDGAIVTASMEGNPSAALRARAVAELIVQQA